MSHPPALARWHACVQTRSAADLPVLLAEDVVLHSPVVHRPIPGRMMVMGYLRAALHVIGTPDFRYVREIVGPSDAMLEFEVTIDGIHVNGVDIIRWNDAGQIVDFKVMLRPLKAVNLIHQKMGEMLAAAGMGG